MLITVEKSENATPAWNRALARAVRENAEGVFFPMGEYHFHEEETTDRYCHFSNNDSGPKKIVMHLENLRDFTVAGDNARFIFHGRLTPLLAAGCRNLTLRGFSIDFADSFVSDGKIIHAGENCTDIEIADPHRIENGELHFFHDVFETESRLLRFMLFDTERNEPAANARDLNCPQGNIIDLGNGAIRVPLAIGKTGDVVVIKHQKRYNPGLVLDRCRQVSVNDVTVHHCGGMAFLAQCSEALHLNAFKVTPSPRFRRRISASDDAIHMVDCRGHIRIENCLLENQWDDGINIHGVYRQLRWRKVGATPFIFLETRHFQQLGIEAVRPGDTLEFIKSDTLKPCGTAVVRSACPLNKQITSVEFGDPLPPEVSDGDAARNLAPAAASVLIRNCTLRRNKPRGILVSGVKEAIIENNYFHTAGAGVYISGDANFWFESGPVEEVHIRHNTFDHCNFMAGATGATPIAIVPEIPRLLPDFYYHGKIVIHDNKFVAVSPKVVHAVSTEHLEFTGNEILSELPGSPEEHLTAINCGKITLE